MRCCPRDIISQYSSYSYQLISSKNVKNNKKNKNDKNDKKNKNEKNKKNDSLIIVSRVYNNERVVDRIMKKV